MKDGVDCLYFNGNLIINTTLLNQSLDKTVGVRCNYVSGGGCFWGSNPCGVFEGEALVPESNGNLLNYVWYNNRTSYGGDSSQISPSYLNSWHLFIVSNRKIYFDGVLVGDYSSITTGIAGNRYMSLGGHAQGSTCTKAKMTGYMSNFFAETGERTQEEITKYFNRMKRKYGY